MSRLGPEWHPCPTDPGCPHCQGASAGATDWSFAEAAYCISLKTRPDRAAAVAAEFHRVGLCRRVRFYRPDKHPRKGVIGSWESHRAVAMDALERGARRVLILEDDVRFVRLGPGTGESIRRALERLPDDWTLFFLGHWPLAAWFVGHHVLRTSSACAHAYLASPRLLAWLRDHPWGSPGVAKHAVVGRSLDAAYARLPATYALFPMIAVQAVSRSDNFNSGPPRPKARRKLKDVIRRSRQREALIAHLMRPNEALIALLSPAFYLRDRWRRRRRP